MLDYPVASRNIIQFECRLGKFDKSLVLPQDKAVRHVRLGAQKRVESVGIELTRGQLIEVTSHHLQVVTREDLVVFLIVDRRESHGDPEAPDRASIDTRPLGRLDQSELSLACKKRIRPSLYGLMGHLMSCVAGHIDEFTSRIHGTQSWWSLSPSVG